jgi:uncharacterized protein (DUF924 family)
MPLQHSETLEDQRRSVRLCERPGDPEALAFARKHHDVIARFGRFPHRAAVLGRAAAAPSGAVARIGQDR